MLAMRTGEQKFIRRTNNVKLQRYVVILVDIFLVFRLISSIPPVLTTKAEGMDFTKAEGMEYATQ